jgi:hypothetical protein
MNYQCVSDHAITPPGACVEYVVTWLCILALYFVNFGQCIV